MEIYSALQKGKITVEGYENYGNFILHHRSLMEFMINLDPKIDARYEVVSSDVDHSVVQCTISSDITGRTMTAFGETSQKFLPKNFKAYPTIIAADLAFDRAAIRYLNLPHNTYSVLEFQMNTEQENLLGPTAPDANNAAPPANNPAEHGRQLDQTAGPQGEGQGKQDNGKPQVGDYILDFGPFKGRSVAQVFQESETNPAMKATLQLYLSKDPAVVNNSSERVAIIGLRKYNAERGN